MKRTTFQTYNRRKGAPAAWARTDQVLGPFSIGSQMFMPRLHRARFPYMIWRRASHVANRTSIDDACRPLGRGDMMGGV